MSLDFTFATGTVVYLDPHGRIKATLLGSRSMTVDAMDNKQQLAESMIGNCPANFALNNAGLLYQVGDNNILFGPAGVPVDAGSSSVSSSVSSSTSASVSASPSSSTSSSVSSSASSSVSKSPSSSASSSRSASPSAS